MSPHAVSNLELETQHVRGATDKVIRLSLPIVLGEWLHQLAAL